METRRLRWRTRRGAFVRAGIALPYTRSDYAYLCQPNANKEQPKAMAKHMKFADGSKLKVSHGAAKAIHMVHGALNDENKKKFADMLTHPKGFEKAAHFALSKVSFKIGNDK